MAVSIVHYRKKDASMAWGILSQDNIAELPTAFSTTAELIEYGYAKLAQDAKNSAVNHSVKDVELLSPITAPSQVMCQGANYRQHMIDSGMNPDAKKFNMFFTKSVASITDPTGQIIKPKHVQLLDYEIELTLVIGKKTTSSVQVNQNNLHEYIAGVCIGNDISARDVQIPETQFYKGKSYRTFCPLGPVLCLFAPEDIHYLDSLNLCLKVNGQIRQQDSTANMVFKPAETLTEYSQVTDFNVGDVLLTGTPSGCALGLPSPLLVKAAYLMPEEKRWALFKKGQAKRSQYLKVGDVIESSIQSADGKINLGIQRHMISAE
ncbi:fumarylacetoacetate hydrolase family protein [Acinetobacter pragensis]|uniref:Fumarylacetoacetate hydrolase n=1 Tax=Acinetobacter pragensis TaxID=1806892 RepID=A0A151Y420_9GAMM|nr:fumarylacetoacetate hydrolase family protein [Acinetobacter pragensis]KYQ72770.1 fumarylacetoacetate hydrolase [Acinetobacter pragensis]